MLTERPLPRVWTLQFSSFGLVFALLFFGFSLLPSLLPRTPLFQGVVSGVTAEGVPYEGEARIEDVRDVFGAGFAFDSITGDFTLSDGNANTDKSILAVASKSLTPIFTPLGIQQDNWPATLGVFTGIMAKEVVVGTLDSIYTQLGRDENHQEATPFELWTAIVDAAETVPINLSAIADSLLDPLGMNVGNTSSSEAAAEDQGVNSGIFGAMASRFDGKIGAFAYLLAASCALPAGDEIFLKQ